VGFVEGIAIATALRVSSQGLSPRLPQRRLTGFHAEPKLIIDDTECWNFNPLPLFGWIGSGDALTRLRVLRVTNPARGRPNALRCFLPCDSKKCAMSAIVWLGASLLAFSVNQRGASRNLDGGAACDGSEK
jgi:hypothetical protein